MRIYIVNKSTVLSDAEVLDALPAFQRQTYHIREWWRSSVEYLIYGEPPVDDAWQIVIVDDADIANALGYHDFTPGGRPIAYVFAKTDLDYGYNWQVTLSHELCEMIIDPWISECFETGKARFHATELCDPVEDEQFSYLIHVKNRAPVRVSDFITPNWLIPGSPGVYDYMGHCLQPLEVLEGGYAYYSLDGQWYAEDNFGNRMTPEEFKEKYPTKTRLALYAREKGNT